MKKLPFLSMIALIGITASAADVTKEKFVATKKAQAEKAGKPFDEKTAVARFNKLDLNKDGVLSANEQIPPSKKAE